ncbi:GNAT family N-acetyltransferase [Wenxinia marina]|uniref:Acetyltransferase n=1 Tax=Wenxinia marina DSM 24838 TaxID=1123501 RepID=A0A0D0QAJ7_9RHOB|nr:GNAT family N-acetyltransferase [Wenxinia marina]KIQ68003.1 Acetyltransferase [Wenxinia marina DSM 24838]GGL75474.1 N-acetyltransferase [Wenxinia marina]
MMAPTLHTDRLTLRPLVPADFEDYAILMASERSRWMGGPAGTDKAWGMFCTEAAGWALFGAGGLAITVTGDDRSVGTVQINIGPLFPETELGWQLWDGAEGRGYATEAGAALRDWAFGPGGMTTLVSYMDPANRASARVAERLGGRLDPDAKVQDEGDIAYRFERTAA